MNTVVSVQTTFALEMSERQAYAALVNALGSFKLTLCEEVLQVPLSALVEPTLNGSQS